MYHKMFLDIIKKASNTHRPASIYLHDVLSLQTRQLLQMDGTVETASMMELRNDFKQHIRCFIQSQKMKGAPVCTLFMEFVVCIMQLSWKFYKIATKH